MIEFRVLGPKTGPERRAGYRTNFPPTPASLEGPWSLLSQRSERSLQGLTCEKKTESILVKAANLYSKIKMT